jgi:hypothetical protein
MIPTLTISDTVIAATRSRRYAITSALHAMAATMTSIDDTPSLTYSVTGDFIRFTVRTNIVAVFRAVTKVVDEVFALGYFDADLRNDIADALADFASDMVVELRTAEHEQTGGEA